MLCNFKSETGIGTRGGYTCLFYGWINLTDEVKVSNNMSKLLVAFVLPYLQNFILGSRNFLTLVIKLTKLS